MDDDGPNHGFKFVTPPVDSRDWVDTASYHLIAADVETTSEFHTKLCGELSLVEHKPVESYMLLRSQRRHARPSCSATGHCTTPHSCNLHSYVTCFYVTCFYVTCFYVTCFGT